MHVLFVHTQPEHRSEYKVHETLIRYLRIDQIESDIVARVFPKQTKTGALLDTRYIHFPYNFLPSESGGWASKWSRMTTFPAAAWYLFQEVKRIQPDVIYSSQHRQDILLAYLVSKLTGIPHVVHIHYPIGPWLGFFALRVIKRSKHIFAVSEYIRETAMLNKILPGSVHTIVNTVPSNDDHQKSEVGHRQLRAEFGWPASAKVVIAVGRIDPSKGYHDLVEAFRIVRLLDKDARLLICGVASQNKQYELDLKAYATRLGLDDVVEFAGFRRDIPFLMANSDIFCLPTVLEAFGLVFLEAMDAHLPVVAYHSGGAPEVVINEKTGLLCYPKDIQALATNLMKLLRDASLRDQMGEAGHARLKDSFSGSRISRLWLNTLIRIVDMNQALDEHQMRRNLNPPTSEEIEGFKALASKVEKELDLI